MGQLGYIRTRCYLLRGRKGEDKGEYTKLRTALQRIILGKKLINHGF